MTAKFSELYNKNAVILKPLWFEIKKHVRKGHKVIDLGCKTGLYIDQLAKKVGKEGKIIGIDINKELLSHCRRKFSSRNIVIKKLEAQKVFKAGHKADVVFASLVLHFTNLSKSITQIRKVLVKDGKLILAIPLYRTGLTKSVDKNSKSFKSEFHKNLKYELKKRGITTTKISLDYPNARAKPLKDMLLKNRFRILRWDILPLTKSGLKNMLSYYKIPWRSEKILDVGFQKRYDIIW